MPKCVLIVEDEALLRRTLASALREAGYRAVTAESAEDAEAHLFPVPRVDLVLLDQRLPKAKGTAVLQRLREGEADCPVILMTAYDATEVREAAGRWAQGYVTKPFDLGRMIEEVERLLGRNGRAVAGASARKLRGPPRAVQLEPAVKSEGGDAGMAARRRKTAKKASRKKSTRRKSTRRKKATRKKSTRKKATRRKKASRKKSTRKKATRRKKSTRKKSTRKKSTRKKATRRKSSRKKTSAKRK